MTASITIDGYGLAAIVVVVIAILIIAGVIAARDHSHRIARIGIFVERELPKPPCEDDEKTFEWPPKDHPIAGASDDQ